MILVAVAAPSAGLINVGEVNVLFVNVSVPANVDSMPAVGNVIFVTPVDVINVSYGPNWVKLPAVLNSVPFAKVNVPVLFVIVTLLIVVAVAAPIVGVINVGDVNVLFVKVSVPANVAKVPVVGKVTLVAADDTNVVG